MIQFVKGSIFDSPAQAIINTVNCEGVMGKGLALQFKKRYNAMYRDYVKVCWAGDLRPGKLHTFEEKGKLIINFPTKDTWRRKSKIEYIVDGLDALVELIKEQNIRSVAVPPLGAGNGGLDWSEVKKVILDKLTDFSSQVEFYIYEPLENFHKAACVMPKLSVKAYLLMDIMVNVGTGDYRMVKAATYFVNYLMRKKYFCIERVGKLPKEGVVEDILKEVNKYKACNANKPYDELQRILKSQIKGKKFASDIEKITPYISDSCAIVKDLKGEEHLICVMEIMERLRKSKKKVFSETDLLLILKEKYDDVVVRNTLDVLSDHHIVERSLFGIQLVR